MLDYRKWIIHTKLFHYMYHKLVVYWFFHISPKWTKSEWWKLWKVYWFFHISWKFWSYPKSNSLTFFWPQVWTKMTKLEMWEVEISTYTRVIQATGFTFRAKNRMEILLVVKLHGAVENYLVLHTTSRSSPLSLRSSKKLAGGLKGFGGSSPATTVHDMHPSTS